MQIQLLRADITSMKVDAIVSVTETNDDSVTAGNLLCKFIIHTPSPKPDDDDLEDGIRRSTLSALERAETLAVESVAMPVMCNRLPDNMMSRCAEIMLEATVLFGRRARSLRRVVYCLFDENDYEVFENALRKVTR